MTEPRKYLNFRRGEDDLEILRRWHRWLHHERHRGECAGLRRARTPLDVVMQPAFHRLVANLEGAGYRVRRPSGDGGDRLAVVAALAAHVQHNISDLRFAEQMAAGGAAGPGVSEMRFRRLLEIEDPTLLLNPLRRAIRLLKGRAHLGDLASAVMAWGPRADHRRRWAYDYYAKAPRKEKSA